MKLLEQRIAREGKVLPGSIVKVDGFLNLRGERYPDRDRRGGGIRRADALC